MTTAKSIKYYMKGITFQVKRFGKKRVSLEIIKPKPDKDGFVNKFFKRGRLRQISFYKHRTMTRDFFDKSFILQK